MKFSDDCFWESLWGRSKTVSFRWYRIYLLYFCITAGEKDISLRCKEAAAVQ